MIKETSEKMGYFHSVISSNRPKNVGKLQQLVGPATWFVPAGQGRRYRLAGAERVEEVEHPTTARPLAYQRNAALEAAFSQGFPCLQHDDDIYRVRYIPLAVDPPCRWNKCPDLRWDDMLVLVMKRLYDLDDVMHSGATATPNPFFTSNRMTLNRFVASGWMLTRPNPIRFDVNLALKEDYDYTLQHLRDHDAVLRHEDIFFMYSKTNSGGGVTDYRNETSEANAILYLREKWGHDIIRANPRSPATEIIMKWDRDDYDDYMQKMMEGVN